MKVSHSFFWNTMLVIIMFIGVLPFFKLPKYLAYTLLIVAIVFGAIGLLKKFNGGMKSS